MDRLVNSQQTRSDSCGVHSSPSAVRSASIATPPRGSYKLQESWQKLPMGTEQADELKLWARFENKDEFITLRDQILALDLYSEPSRDQDDAEWPVFQKISNIVCIVPPFAQNMTDALSDGSSTHIKNSHTSGIPT